MVRPVRRHWTDGSTTSVSLTLASASTVATDGSLSLNPGAGGYAMLTGAGGVTIGSGGALSTAGATNIAYSRTVITNQSGGTVTFGAPTTNQ